MHRRCRDETWPPDDEWAALRIAEWEVSGWVDTFGIDSVYDYDPVWAKAVELRMPLAAHTAGIGFSDRASVSNFVYNQIGHFAASGAALAKSLFLGGVTRRFPELRVALLEGGAAVGVETFLGLASTWQKRGGEAIRALDPDNIDADLLYKLLTESDPRLSRYSAEQLKWQGSMKTPHDDFEAAGITSLEDVRDLFCTPFSWGCEADDPLVGLGLRLQDHSPGSQSPGLLRLRPGALGRARNSTSPSRRRYELVERQILGEGEFEEFVFTNPVRFYASMNPDFFAGTSIDAAAAKISAR